MEVFLLLVLIVLVIWMNSSTSSNVKKLSAKLDELRKEIAKKSFPEKYSPPVKEEKPQIFSSPAPEIIKTEIVEEKKEEKEKIVVEEKVIEEKPSTIQYTYTPPPPPKPKVKKPTFFERNPDLEKFIGENLINKIGIAVLVLGIAFFVKYAIDKDWINEIGRTAIGILCGGILLGFAHYLRMRFKAFSSVLIGGGIAVLYFTIAIAFHEYQLFSQTVAFIIMVFITGFAVTFSLAYNRIELAIISIIGGFATPFMVSTGEGNYIVLFTYLMILNTGMLVLAYYKKWNLINILSYIFTIIIYGGWLATELDVPDKLPKLGAFIFGSLFYFTFFCMNIVNNIKENRKFDWLDFAILLSNTFLFYAAGMGILHFVRNGFFQGTFTASLAIFNFLFAFYLYKNQKADRNLFYLLIGLVLTFASLTAPIQLEGSYITLFWAAETVLLLWLSQKSGIVIMKLASVVVMLLMMFSLLMDWGNIYFGFHSEEKTMMVALNKGFITGIISALSIFITTVLLRKEKNATMFSGFEVGVYRNILFIILVIFLYFVPFLELNYQLYKRIEFGPSCQVIIGFYHMLFLIALHIYAMKKEILYFRETLLLVSGFSFMLYLLLFNSQIILVRDNYLETGNATMTEYLFHYLTVASTLALLFLFFKTFKKVLGLNSEIGTVLLWFTAFIAVYIASAELSHASVMLSFSANPSVDDILNQTYKIGFPILWGICSFVLMVIGMRAKMKHVRIISLSLFFITLLKLFIFDIRGISEGGKIAAFISLGIILLVVSFMYQKLKVLILEDNPDKK